MTSLTLHFTGTLTQVPIGEQFEDFQEGEQIQGSYAFDTTAMNLIPGDPATASYHYQAPLGCL